VAERMGYLLPVEQREGLACVTVFLFECLGLFSKYCTGNPSTVVSLNFEWPGAVLPLFLKGRFVVIC
jgi:hypothetical protein